MTAQNRARTAATASIILTHLVTLLGTSDRRSWFRAGFVNFEKWLRWPRFLAHPRGPLANPAPANSPLVKCESDQTREEQDKTGHGHGQEAVRSNFFAHGTPPIARAPRTTAPGIIPPQVWSDNKAEQGLVRSAVLTQKPASKSFSRAGSTQRA